MAIPKFTLYKHVKLDSGWRYCKAGWHSNGKVKPNVVLVKGVEEMHRDGSYYLNHNNTWIRLIAEHGKFERTTAKHNAIEKRMTSTEIAEGQRLTREWFAAHPMPSKWDERRVCVHFIDHEVYAWDGLLVSRAARKIDGHVSEGREASWPA